MSEGELRFTREEVKILFMLSERPRFIRRLTTKYDVVYRMVVRDIVEIVESPLLKNRKLVRLTDKGREIANMLRIFTERVSESLKT
ncbi:MAG: hypothetical protein DRJ37_06160 [Thermoprotei archaeon]|nr:MAG: hypothetical protein DRJ37_06160 [Thermoprotei archaeon]